jgi:hypothetical protein
MPASQSQFQAFCLGDFTASDPYQSSQKCVNLYPETLKNEGVKVVTALLGCPGLTQVATAVGL